ncbi:MAG: tetratricopeptide repeat protein [Chloroflexota bacterium]
MDAADGLEEARLERGKLLVGPVRPRELAGLGEVEATPGREWENLPGCRVASAAPRAAEGMRCELRVGVDLVLRSRPAGLVVDDDGGAVGGAVDPVVVADEADPLDLVGDPGGKPTSTPKPSSTPTGTASEAASSSRNRSRTGTARRRASPTSTGVSPAEAIFRSKTSCDVPRPGSGPPSDRAWIRARPNCLGDYPEALRLARAGYEAFDSANHRWGVTSALCRLGFAEAALGDGEGARRDLGRALELAGRGHAQSLVLHALSGVGVLLAREGDDARAAELLIASLEHPGMPATYRMVAQPTLDALVAQLAPAALAAAREAAASTDLETLVDAVRRDLASGAG